MGRSCTALAILLVWSGCSALNFNTTLVVEDMPQDATLERDLSLDEDGVNWRETVPGGVELSTFHQSLACGYLDEAAAEQNPISFEGLNNFIEGLGGVVDGILGLFNPPTSQAQLTTASGAGQLNDAKLGRYLIGLAVLLGLILAGVYLIKRKK